MKITDEQKILGLVISSAKEGKRIDFKETFDPNSSIDWAGVIKDIIAMANSGGGALLFGKTDDGKKCDFDRQIVLGIDPATVSDKIHSYTNEHFSEFEITEVKVKNNKFALIIIKATKIPIIFTRNGSDLLVNGKQKPIFLKGSVYFRHGAKSEPGTTTDLKDAIDRVVNEIRKVWFDGMRKVSKIETNDEVIITKKNPALRGQPFSLDSFLKVSETGVLVKLSHSEFEALRKEYPLEYNDVLKRCKKKKLLPQKKLQAYINSCKDNQDLSINWKIVGKSLNLPFVVPDKYMYKEKVVENF